jgi:hypothetical protein
LQRWQKTVYWKLRRIGSQTFSPTGPQETIHIIPLARIPVQLKSRRKNIFHIQPKYLNVILNLQLKSSVTIQKNSILINHERGSYD